MIIDMSTLCLSYDNLKTYLNYEVTKLAIKYNSRIYYTLKQCPSIIEYEIIFDFDNRKFQTLEELERALKNKALL